MLVGHSPFYDPQTYVWGAVRALCPACAALYLSLAPRMLTSPPPLPSLPPSPPPFRSNDNMTICRNILQQKLAFPTSLKDVKAKDLVRKLLARDAGRRLGMIKGGGEAIKHQRWYSEHHKLDFDKLDAQTPEMDAWVPWVPKCKDKVGASTRDSYRVPF